MTTPPSKHSRFVHCPTCNTRMQGYRLKFHTCPKARLAPVQQEPQEGAPEESAPEEPEYVHRRTFPIGALQTFGLFGGR